MMESGPLPVSILRMAASRIGKEKEDEKIGFCKASCYLPEYRIEGVEGFSQKEMDGLQQIIQETAHLIMEFSKSGGFENASGF